MSLKTHPREDFSSTFASSALEVLNAYDIMAFTLVTVFLFAFFGSAFADRDFVTGLGTVFILLWSIYLVMLLMTFCVYQMLRFYLRWRKRVHQEDDMSNPIFHGVIVLD